MAEVFDTLLVMTNSDSILAIILVGFNLFLIILGSIIAAYFIMVKFRYPIEVFIIGNDGGGYYIKAKDKAQMVKLDSSGFAAYWLRKNKIYRQAYGKMAGHRKLIFVIGSDGLWRNATFSDFDKQLRELSFFIVEKDARASNVRLRKIIEQKHNKEGWQKYSGIIILGTVIIVLIVIGILFYLNYAKWNQMAQTNKEAIAAASLLIERTTQLQNQTIQLVEQAGIMIQNAQGGSGIR